MKNTTLPLFCSLLMAFLLSGCSEKELLLPEQVSGEKLESLKQRPSLRPDSVKVYPAFYNSVEIAYPDEQPERAVRSRITYTKDDGVEEYIDVSDFDEVIKIEDLSIREYAFTIVYYTEEGISSNPVVQRVTPYLPLTDYSFQTLNGYGQYGSAFIHWDNITGKEVQVTIEYEENGTSRSVTKLSSILRDTIVINDLSNTDHIFEVKVEDLDKPYSSEVKELKLNPGISPENYALTSLSSSPGYGRALLTWDNPTQVPLRIALSYMIDNEPTAITFEDSESEGKYTLVNLPEGITSVMAIITNMRNNSTTPTRILDLVAEKGVKESISEALAADAYGNNYAVLRIDNPSDLTVDVKVKYEKRSGGQYEGTLQVDGHSQQAWPLSDVKADAKLSVTVIDDIGSYTTDIATAVTDAAMSGVELDRTGWTALASSERNTTNQSASAVLDGLYGSGTAGWVSQWGGGTDLLGKSSLVFPHFIQLDMKDVKYVTGFRTINHSNGTQNGAGTFILQYSMDGESFIDVQTYNRGTTTADASISYTIDQPILARYIRYYAVNSDSNSGIMRMAEFYITGLE